MIVYRSSDAGAPSGSGGAGGLMGVLVSCLVSGYGSKSGAGWSVVAQEPNRVMLAPQTPVGRQSYVFVVDDTRPGYALVYGGTEPIQGGWSVYEMFPGMDLLSVGGPGVLVRRSSTWVVVADEYSCMYVGVGVASGSGKQLCSFLFMGHVKAVDPKDPYTGAVVGESDDPAYGYTFVHFLLHRSRGRLFRSVLADYWRPRNPLSFASFLSVPFSSLEEMRYIRGLYVLLGDIGSVAYDSGAVFDGVGGLSGRTFELYWLFSGVGFLLETSGWEVI